MAARKGFRLSGQRVFSAYSRRLPSCIVHHKCRSHPSIHYHSLTSQPIGATSSTSTSTSLPEPRGRTPFPHSRYNGDERNECVRACFHTTYYTYCDVQGEYGTVSRFLPSTWRRRAAPLRCFLFLFLFLGKPGAFGNGRRGCLIAPASSQVSCFLGRDPERRDEVMCVCVWRELRFVGIGSDMRESEVSLFGWTLPLSASSASAVAVRV